MKIHFLVEPEASYHLQEPYNAQYTTIISFIIV
jgi:hypothetical protein